MLNLVLVVLFSSLAAGDINSGCPFWGCLPRGTFSFSAGIPTATNQMKWSTEIDSRNSSDIKDPIDFLGCVSDQQTVVCATSRGYVSLDPVNGNILWNYTTKATPYLPVMDIYGDVIGMDKHKLYYVGSDGKPKNPININILQPAFSVMVANDSILFLTSTNPKTAQVITYGTDGIIDASITLTGVVERANGTFVPCSQPVIDGFRVYVLTQFVPNDMTSETAQRSLGMQRLYALDLRARMTERIQIMWYFNLENEGRRPLQTGNGKPWTSSRFPDDIIFPIVMSYQGVVYINNVGPQTVRRSLQDSQPYASVLYALKDLGNDAQLLYKKSCWYGPLAAFDTYSDSDLLQGQQQPDSTLSDSVHVVSERRTEDDAVIWILNRSPPMISCNNAKDGRVLGMIDLISVSKINGWATSKMGVTRLSHNSSKDVLVVGMQDSDTAAAYLVAVEADRKAPNNASLIFSTKIGGASNSSNASSSRYRISGQIVNVAFQNPGQKVDVEPEGYHYQKLTDWKLGVVALVEETGPGYVKLHTAAVF